MPPKLAIETTTKFDELIWNAFKKEIAEIAIETLKQPQLAHLASHFDAEAITNGNLALIEHADTLLEREFPQHGAAAHFLLSTLPIPGLYDPIVEDHTHHNCLQYFAFIKKNTHTCLATCGFYMLNKDCHDALWSGWLVLDPAFRSQGFGKGMMIFCMEVFRAYGKKHGQKKLRFLTSNEPHVQAARSLYNAFGARELKCFPNPYTPGYDAVILECDISHPNPSI